MCGFAATLVVVIGVLGLISGSRLRLLLEPWVDVHVLFALLLCGLVAARYQWKVKHSPPTRPSEVRDLSRNLSRITYLLLYVVVGTRQILGILNSLWLGSAVDFNLFDERFRSGPDYAGFNPKDDFQLFLACGLCALILIRVLAFRLEVSLADCAARWRPTSDPRS